MELMDAQSERKDAHTKKDENDNDDNKRKTFNSYTPLGIKTFP